MAGRVSAQFRRAVLLLMCWVFLLFGCVSFGQGGGRPGWISHIPVRGDMVSFVGHGEDSNPFNARLAALRDILSQVSDTLGEDIQSKAWREFSLNDEVEAYSLSVVHVFTQGDETWVLAEARKDTLESLRTGLQKQKLETDAQARALIAKGEEAYRANQDGIAIERVLDAIDLCVSQPSTYSLSDLVDQACRYLGALRLTFSHSRPAVPSVDVKVSRSLFLLNPKVKDCDITATFSSHDVWGRSGSDTMLFNTGDEGVISFRPYSTALADRGTVVFTPAVATRIQGMKLDDELKAKLLSSITSATFSYDRKSLYQGKTLLLGSRVDGDYDELVEAKVRSFLSSKGIATLAVEGQPVTEEYLASVHASHPEADYYLEGTFGRKRRQEIGDYSLFVWGGSLKLWDLNSGELVSETGEMELTAESDQDALEKLLDVVTDRFSEYLQPSL